MTILNWLDPAKEIKIPDQPGDYAALHDIEKSIQFMLWCLSSLLGSGLTPKEALWVISNFISETGWGKKWKGNNFGGWKITEAYVKEYKASHNGESPLWWQAPGHIASGDPPVVYYRGYATYNDFIQAWLLRFVPINPKPDHRYYKTSKAFWAGDASWFKELCLAGYKGPVTQANPDASVVNFGLIVDRARMLLVQHFLHAFGILHNAPDGSWGPISINACKFYQAHNNLQQTGLPDEATFVSIVNKSFLAGSR